MSPENRFGNGPRKAAKVQRFRGRDHGPRSRKTGSRDTTGSTFKAASSLPALRLLRVRFTLAAVAPHWANGSRLRRRVRAPRPRPRQVATTAHDEALYLLLRALGLPLDSGAAVLARPLAAAERSAVSRIFRRRILDRVPAAYLTHVGLPR